MSLYEQAEPTLAWLTYVRRHEIDMYAIAAFAGVLGICHVRFRSDHRFDFDEHGEPAVVCQVLGTDAASTIDLVAWDILRPERVATALGEGDGLGIWQVLDPASYFAGQFLHVHRTPLGWIKAGCRGVTILDAESASRWLGAALGNIAAEDASHARYLARLLRTVVPASRIFAPLPEAA